MGQKALSLLVSCCLFVPLVSGQELTAELVQCVAPDNQTAVDARTQSDINVACVRDFLWKTQNIDWSAYNVTNQDKEFINSLIVSYFHRGRRARHASFVQASGIFPDTGYRIRREYRRLSDNERFRFHLAINIMKKTGQYDIFANMHSGKLVMKAAHDGPALLAWHRVYIAMFEEALRRIDPKISLPYWDSSLDYDMQNPVDSIIWTKHFMGNGNGFVRSGPFANWYTSVGKLARNIGGSSTLMSKDRLAMFSNLCHLAEIAFPTAKPMYDSEKVHGGPHLWVGGQMAGMNTAAQDPIFFLHHAFIDFIWEMFRMQQKTNCGINPANDYPNVKGLQKATNPMVGFPQYRIIDGMSNIWTQFWYRYEPSPTCSKAKPYCGTPYLFCDINRDRCVSVAVPQGASTAGSAMRARAQASSLPIGPVFRAPPAEPRTQDGSGMAFMGGKHALF